jgi:adenylate kinase family enzyme
MLVKLFILGRPGSGKSSAARIIATIARCRGWNTTHINDYDILKEMAQADTTHENFRQTEHSGFAVRNFSVLDVALRELENRAQHLSLEQDTLVIIEFARDDYSKALKWFSPGFLQDAYFLFMHLDLDTCVQRIQKRITYTYTDPPISDNHYVSEEIVRGYYQKDNRQYIKDSLKTDYSIMKLIRNIDNSGSWLELRDNVLRFVDIIFWQESGGSKLISSHISWTLLLLKGNREL